MKIHHHIDDELLVSYAAGSLSEGWSIAVATHLSLCPTCRARLRTAESVGASLFERETSDMAVDQAWATMRGLVLQQPAITAFKPSVQTPSKQYETIPLPLRSYLGSGDIDQLKWRALGRGAYHIPIETGDQETKVRLLRIPAGKPVPEHTHGGRELTLVLRGSFRDGGELFARGDIEDADASLTHQPIATEHEDCICLAVTDAPLRFSSWLMRTIQPILGI